MEQLWETLLQPKSALFFKMLLFPAPSVITMPAKAEVWTQLQKNMQTVVQTVLENNYFHQPYKLSLCLWEVCRGASKCRKGLGREARGVCLMPKHLAVRALT